MQPGSPRISRRDVLAAGMSVASALAMMDAHERLPWHYAEWERVEAGWSPWLLEARWGLDFMLKMQDPSTIS